MSAESKHSPDEPLDEVDVALLADLARIAEELDPVPAGLVRAVLRLGAHDASHDSPWSSMMSRSLARQRPRVEPMLPTGMPIAAEMDL